MKPRLTLMLLIGAFALALATTFSWAQKKSSGSSDKRPEKTESAVVKFVSMNIRATPQNQHVVLLRVASPAGGGSAIELIVPPENQQDMDILKDAKAGDLLEVRFYMQGNKRVVDFLNTYNMRPGEEEPGTYVFVKTTTQKVGSRDVPGVVASRFKREMTFLVPMVRGADNKMAPSEEIRKAIDSLKEDDLIEIQASSGGAMATIKSIGPYEPPKRGEFGTFVPRFKADTGDFPAVEIKDEDGATQTLMIAVKDRSALLGKVRSIKARTPVLYRSTTDDKGNTWLTAIGPVPKDRPPAPSKDNGKDKPKGKDSKDKTEAPSR